jgi:hypothetical protein
MSVSLSTFHNYTLDRGYGNVVLEVRYYGKDYSTILESGTNDDIDVFKIKGDPRGILVYGQSRYTDDYVSLAYYEIGEKEGLSDHTGERGLIGDRSWTVYFQGHQAEENLGKGWQDKTALRNAKIMYQWLD